MALKDKLMTLEDFKAVRDVDVASNSAQFTEIRADLGDVGDASTTPVVTDTDNTVTWTFGIMSVSGTVTANTSYMYSNAIPVSEGDLVTFVRDDSGTLAKASKVTSYSNGTAVADKGANSNVSLPFTVPAGVDSVQITVPSAYSSNTHKYRVTSTSLISIDKADIDKIKDYMSVKSMYYPLANSGSYANYVKCILGLWIKNPVSGASYYLSGLRYNQVTSGTTYTRLIIGWVVNGTAYTQTVFDYGSYTPSKTIEFIDTDFAYVCIDWSKITSGTGFSGVSLSSDTILDESVLNESNTLAIATGETGASVSEKLVTQIQRVTTTEKEVVASQVDVVDSARNAANGGVLPSNDGTTNFANLQALIDSGGTIVIDVPGTYEINGMLTIGSNTELIFGAQVYMKQMNSSGGFIVNKGASTGVYNENIRISGLHLICNSMTGTSSSYKLGLRGKIAFCYVRNLILEGIYVDDIPSATYFIHVAAYQNVLIQNCHIEGNKDGVHSSGGDGLTIRDCYFRTGDDPIALNSQDYPSSIPYYGWIKNVLIENCVDDSPAGAGNVPRARSILLLGGAWLDWASGNAYRNGDTVVASNGCVYRFLSETATSDETATESMVEPDHLSGTVTESDGCKWMFVQDTPIYNVGCENVVVRNYHVVCPRVDVFRLHNDDSVYVRSIYPGAIMPPHNNIVFENVHFGDDASTYFLVLMEPADNVKIINSYLKCTYIYRVQGTYTVSDANATINSTLAGTTLYRKSGEINLAWVKMTGKILNIKAYGNYANRTVYNSAVQGTINMLANDLF